MAILKEMIANGTIQPEELVEARELIERAELVKKAMEASKRVIQFPLGSKVNYCYDYMDRAGEYHAWGNCTDDGVFTCFCNWGGTHEIGKCNLLDFASVFNAFENKEFEHDLKRFLNQMLDEE